MNRRRIIIDCDPGHDDVMAILSALAHKEEIEILGYTTVCGNQILDKVTRNLCSVLSMIKEDGVIAKGYTEPIFVEKDPQPAAHGETGLDGPVLSEPTIQPIDNHAIEFIRECAEKYDDVTLVALAPLTNIAMFLKTYPHLKNRIKEIALMGGSIYGGNILPCAEFNLYADPHAAHIVFSSGLPITMAPIEICSETGIYHHEIDNLIHGGPVSRLAHDILQFFSLYNRRRNRNQSPIFDLVPIMDILYPELYESVRCKVDSVGDGELSRGMSVVQIETEGNVKVLLHVNRVLMIQNFLDDLKTLDERVRRK